MQLTKQTFRQCYQYSSGIFLLIIPQHILRYLAGTDAATVRWMSML